MAVNRGKEFEFQIRKGFERIEDVSIDRLLDPMSGYAGVRNICDFIVYSYPNQFYLECKSHHGNTLPFSCITDNQWYGLLEKSKIPGVVAGVVVWFIDRDITVFVPIDVLQFLREQGHKSISYNVSKAGYPYLLINGKKKRVLFEYDLKDFVLQAKKLYGGI